MSSDRTALQRAHEELDAIFRERTGDPELFTALRRVEKVITDALATPDPYQRELERAAYYNKASGAAHKTLTFMRDCLDEFIRTGNPPRALADSTEGEK